MKSMRLCAILILSALAVTGDRLSAQPTIPPSPSAPPAAAAPGAGVGPQIQFDEVVYDFGKVTIGDKARHTYVVTNTGTATLNITNVHPGCHCTTAGDWTHIIEPGKTGQIPVQFDSTGFNGNITRTIEVFSNAKNEPRKTLQLKCTIWKPIEYASTAVISIPADSSNDMSTTVHIVSKTDGPVTLSNPVSAKAMFDAVLKETTPGKEFDLVITAHAPFPSGNTSGAITIGTSLTNLPTIRITAMANVTPAVQVSPSQIVLNPLPDRASTNKVTILSNTTNELVLSNPKAKDSQIQVSIEPGVRKGMYTLVVVTPPGFNLAPGQRSEVTVDSTNPHYPLITVPIMQFPRPGRGAQYRPVASLPATAPAARASGQH